MTVRLGLALLAATCLATACSPADDRASERQPATGETGALAEGQVSPELSASPSQPADDADSLAQSPAGNALAIERGVYVIAGSGCEQPANAAIRIYDGRGISGSSTRDCRIEPVATDGARHEIEQSCINTYDGSRTSERQVVEVLGTRSFALTSPFGGGTYELCPGLDPADFTASG